MATIINNMISRYNKRNAINVKGESERNKRLLKEIVHYVDLDVDNDNEVFQKCIELCNVEDELCKSSREDLLHLAILSATTVNDKARRVLIDNISMKLGRIKNKDFNTVLSLLKPCKDRMLVVKVHDYLSEHLEGYADMYDKYCISKFGINKR